MPVKKRSTINQRVEAKPILPGDETFTEIETGRGRRKNYVALALDEMMQVAVSKGHTLFQLPNNNPFTITQVRYWAKGRNDAHKTYSYLSSHRAGDQSGSAITWQGPTLLDDIAKHADASVFDEVSKANHIQVSGKADSAIIQIALVQRKTK